MAAATMFEIQGNAIKWAITTPILMKIGTQTKKNMLPEVRIIFKHNTGSEGHAEFELFKMAAAVLEIQVHAIK
jgi:hypothetical protein